MRIPLTCIQLPESLHKVQVGTGWEQEQIVRLSIAASRVPNTSNAYAHLNFSALPFSLTLISQVDHLLSNILNLTLVAPVVAVLSVLPIVSIAGDWSVQHFSNVSQRELRGGAYDL